MNTKLRRPRCLPRLGLSCVPILPILWLIAGLVAELAAGEVASGAPLHPDLRQSLSPEALARIPGEPGSDPVPGLAGSASASGRAWSGNPRALVLLVDFADRPASRTEHDVAHFRDLLFGEDGDREFPSLREYFLEATGQRIDVTGEVFGWFRMPLSHEAYAGGQAGLCGSCFPGNARGLAAHAVEAAVATGIDLRQFDNDGPDGRPDSGDDDGILDAMIVIHAGTGAERTGSPDDIRSHNWTMTAMSEVQGIRIPDYAMIPEEENVGVAVHEFGHLLGGEDLYDLSGRGAGLGDYSVMAHAFWFNNARQPGGPDAYTRSLWGVLDPIPGRVDEPDMDLAPATRERAALRLWSAGREGPEYFLIEHRRREGIDRYLPGEGLLVYHVSTTVPFQNNPSGYRVRVVAADGLGSLQGNPPLNRGEPGDFFPGSLGVREWDDSTHPDARSRDGSETGVALRDVGDPGEVIRFGFEVGRSLALGEPAPELRVEPLAGYFDPFPGVGEPLSLRLEVFNRGTRLRGGTLRLLERDPAVRVIEGGPWDVATLPALGSMEPEGPLRVELRPEAGRGPFAIEAVWSTASGDHRLAAPVPDPGFLRGKFDFETESPRVRPVDLGSDAAEPSWRRQQDIVDRGAWAWGIGGLGGFPAGMDAVLEFGPFEVGVQSELRFRHRMLTVATGDRAFDGGFVEVSRDFGPWESVTPPEGYPATFVLTQANPYPGQSVWAGVIDWRTECIPLEGGVSSLRVRFHFVSDFSASTLRGAGWFIDDLILQSWPSAHRVVFDEPRLRENGLRLEMSTIPLLPHAEPLAVRLVREAPGERLVLNRWLLDDRRDRGVDVPGVTPGQSYLFRLEREQGDGVAGELRVTIPAPEGSLLRGSPTLLSAGRGGWITLRVPGEAPLAVSLVLFDVQGRRVETLVEEVRGPGVHRISWKGRAGNGRSLVPGVYYLRLLVGAHRESFRITLLP